MALLRAIHTTFLFFYNHLVRNMDFKTDKKYFRPVLSMKNWLECFHIHLQKSYKESRSYEKEYDKSLETVGKFCAVSDLSLTW